MKFISLFFLLQFSSLAIAVTDRIIPIQLETTKDLLVSITITNNSTFAYCFREDDFNFEKLGDFLLLESSAGSAKYKGPDVSRRLKYRGRPVHHLIITPGRKWIGSFNLKDIYKVPKGRFNLAIAMPFISCDLAIKEEVELPGMDFMKLRLNYRDINFTAFSGMFPQWESTGLIAFSGITELNNE